MYEPYNIPTYTELWYDINCFRKEVEDMLDEYLVDECLELDHTGSVFVQKAMHDYFKSGELTEESREHLINLYLLTYCEFLWEID